MTVFLTVLGFLAVALGSLAMAVSTSKGGSYRDGLGGRQDFGPGLQATLVAFWYAAFGVGAIGVSVLFVHDLGDSAGPVISAITLCVCVGGLAFRVLYLGSAREFVAALGRELGSKDPGEMQVWGRSAARRVAAAGCRVEHQWRHDDRYRGIARPSDQYRQQLANSLAAARRWAVARVGAWSSVAMLGGLALIGFDPKFDPFATAELLPVIVAGAVLTLTLAVSSLVQIQTVARGVFWMLTERVAPDDRGGS